MHVWRCVRVRHSPRFSAMITVVSTSRKLTGGEGSRGVVGAGGCGVDHMGRIVIKSAIDGSLGYGRPEWDANRSTPVLIEPSLIKTNSHIHFIKTDD